MCTTKFNTSDGLKMHVKNVHECQFCGEAFNLFEDKFTHILLNHKDFCCEFCDKIFSSTDRLKRDILSLRLEIIESYYKIAWWTDK